MKHVTGFMTDLFLDQCQLLQVPLQKRHLLLLGLGVAISNNIVVLLLDLIKLYFKLNNLDTA